MLFSKIKTIKKLKKKTDSFYYTFNEEGDLSCNKMGSSKNVVPRDVNLFGFVVEKTVQCVE